MQELSLNQLIIGATLCCKNSSDLIEEADILFQNKKFNCAYFLYQTAQEEIAKGEDIIWYAHDIIIGLSRNFSGLGKSFLEHKRKNRTNFITLKLYEKETIQQMENLIKIVAKSNSLKEATEKIKEYVINSFPEDEIDRIDTFHKKRMKTRNDSLYVNYDDKNLFYLKSIKKKQVVDIKRETKYLLDNLIEGINMVEDKEWQKKGKELGEFIKNYWDGEIPKAKSSL